MSLQVRAEWSQRGLAVDLDLPPGRHAVTGPNGSGKSSLLSVIAGLARPDSSRVVLDGRVLDITVQVGRIEVLVPRDLTVEATATVHGPGEIRLFGEQRGGIDTRASETHDGGPGSPVLQLDAETNLGEIVVRTR